MTTYSTTTGTTVHVTDEGCVIFDNPGAPEGLRTVEVGRIAEFEGNTGFQPKPFFAGLLGSETLRLLADIVDREARR